MFKLVIKYLQHLLSLIELAENCRDLKKGEDKKLKVIAEFCQLLADLPETEKKKVPPFLLNPENLGCLIDFAVILGNFISRRQGSNLILLAKALLNGKEEK